MKYKNIILLAIISIFSSMLFSQEDTVKFDNVKVIKEFSVKIGDFNKIDIDPILPAFDLENRRYKYEVRAIPMKLEYEKPKIRPLALPEPKPIHLNNYFVKLAYGFPQFLNAELSLGHKSNNKSSNISLTHISANNTSKLKDQRNSTSQLAFSYSNRKNELDLEYGLRGKIDGSYYYLYADKTNSIDSFSTSDNKRRILAGDFRAMFKKEELTNNLDNKTELSYKFIQLNTNKILENIIEIKNTSTYNFNHFSSIKLPLKLKSTLGTKVIKLQAKPYFQYTTRLFNLKLGGDMGKTQDLDFIYPYAEISSNLFDNFIEIFASVDNQIFNNTNYLKSEINPFIDFNNDSISTSVFNNYTAGIRNSLEGAKIEFIATYQKLNNKLFFTPSFEDNRTFASIYESGKNIKLQLNLVYQVLPQLELAGNITNNTYTLDSIAKPWHTPSFTANFSTKTELLNKKLSIKGELYFATQSWYLDFDGNKKKLSSLFDISAKTSYKFLKNSNIFLEVNNIFAQKYQRWYQYPTYGINLLAGLEIRF